MPLNEARSFKRSNLTREQRQQAEAAIYGIRESVVMPVNHFDVSNLSQDQIEAMRQVVMQSDNSAKSTEFDLNNPPKVPYRHQAFPKMIYNHEASEPSRVEVDYENGKRVEKNIEPKIVSAKVGSQEELEEALAAGWSEEVPPQHSGEEVMTFVEPEKPAKRGRK